MEIGYSVSDAIVHCCLQTVVDCNGSWPLGYFGIITKVVDN